MAENYRQLIIDKFDDFGKIINAQHQMINAQLTAIEKQSDKSDRSIEEIKLRIEHMMIVESKHFVDCPNSKKIPILEKRIENIKTEVINDFAEQLQDVNYLRRNPKVFWIALILLLVVAIWVSVEVNKKYNDFISKIEYYNSQMKPVK